MIKSMVIAGLGGFFGTCGRYLVGLAAKQLFSSPFPYGTFAVNIIGSLLIGILFGLAERTNLISTDISLLLITGFCGGFTTFSTFSNDLFVMLNQKCWLYFAAYLLLSVALGLIMVYVGRSLVK